MPIRQVLFRFLLLWVVPSVYFVLDVWGALVVVVLLPVFGGVSVFSFLVFGHLDLLVFCRRWCHCFGWLLPAGLCSIGLLGVSPLDHFLAVVHPAVVVVAPRPVESIVFLLLLFCFFPSGR